MTLVNIGRPLPPPRRSRASELASQWGPQIFTILTILAGALKFNDNALQTIHKLETLVATLEVETARLQRLVGEQSDDLQKFRTNEAKWRTFADAAFCRLSVRPPYGCPDVDYAPEPARGSNAPRIQPRVHAEPLDLDR